MSNQRLPSTINPAEGEEVVKQYHDVATLRTRYKFMKATGKITVTNMRLLFHAAGQSLRGETNLQYEFEMGHIGGVETRKDWRINPINIILSILLSIFTSTIFGALLTFFNFKNYEYLKVTNIFLVILGIIGIIVFVTALRNVPILQIISSSVILTMFLSVYGTSGGIQAILFNSLFGGNHSSGNAFLAFLLIISAVCCIVAIFKNSFVQNLVIIVKTTGATGAVAICRDKSKGLGRTSIQDEYTGYDEVIPGSHADDVIAELGAMISDIQKFGDIGVEKWKQ